MEFSKYAAVNPKCDKVPNSFYYIDLECVNAGEIKDLRIEMAETAPSRAQRLLTLYDILFQTVRPYQKNNYYFKVENDLPTVASTGYAVFRTEQSSEYLYELIHTERFLSDVMKRCTGTSFPAVSSSDIEDIAIWIPEFQEQKKIGDFLTLIDTKIAKQRLLIELLKKYKRGLISGILAGEILIPGVNRKMWKEAHLDKLFTISAGGDIEKEHCSPTKTGKYKFPVYANAMANDGLYGFADYYKVCENSITVTGRGEVGHATSRYEKYVPIVRLLTLVPKEKLDIEFFTLYINQTKIFIESTGVPQLTSPQLGKLKVLVPTYEEQKRISNIVNGLECKIKSEQSYGCLLKDLRKALLQQLFI